MRRTFAILTLGTIAAVTLAVTPATAGARCDEGHWPATVQGKPDALHAGGTAGYYVWHDRNGWHVRTTTPTHRPHHFTGRITSEDDIELVKLVRGEGRDSVTVSGNELTFSFVTYDGIDGVDFTVGCTEGLRFALRRGDEYVSARRIWLGATGHASDNPFRVRRV